MQEASLVPVDVLKKLEVTFVVNSADQLNLALSSLIRNHLKSFIYGAGQIKIVVVNVELVVLQLCEVEKIVDQVLHHFLGVNLSLEQLSRTLGHCINLLEYLNVIFCLRLSLHRYNLCSLILIYDFET